jgi:DNA modification methylase
MGEAVSEVAHKEVIGNATLWLGDCRDILPTLGKVDVCLTDPPYEIVMTGGGIGAKRQYTRDTTGFTDCGFDYQILDKFNNWACFGTLKQVPQLIEKVGDRRWMLVTWNKPNPTPLCNGNYLPDTEYIVHAWRKGGLHGGYKDKSRFIVHPVNDVEDGTHPNEKPLRVMYKMVNLVSGSGSIVLDPFMGSGTTGVAAIQLGRKFIGIEIDPTYFEIACRRIRDVEGHNTLFDPKLLQGDLFNSPHEAPLCDSPQAAPPCSAPASW